MIANGHQLTFNGEIYNYVELREELAALGWRFETTSDTEVLLASVQHWGISALDRLHGMFAFVWHDEAAGRVYLARDRFGKKPLVYSKQGKVFAAASEAKQLIAAGVARPTARQENVLAFLAAGELNRGVKTMFEDVVELAPGHCAEIDLGSGQISTTRWYDLQSKIAPTRDSYSDARERVSELLRRSVVRRHRADVAVGACLSGGIDSSVIVALSAGLHRAEPLTTISVYGREDGFDERQFSRCVASRFRVQRLEIEVDTDKVWQQNTLGEIGYYQDQPILSGSHYNEYCVYKAAKDAGLIVMLGGQGADEYFGGYGEFWFAAQLEHLRRGDLAAFVENLRARAEGTGRSVSRVSADFVRALSWRGAAVGDRVGPYKTRWLRHPPPQSARRASDFRGLAVQELESISIPYQVHSEDRSSMRWSVESRMPFLDHELVEYVLGLPTAYKVGKGYGKRILRDAVPELPSAIARRKDKIGFASPDAQRLRDQAPAVRELLIETILFLGDLVEGSTLLKAFDDMVEGAEWYDPLFFRLASLGGWARAVNASL